MKIIHGFILAFTRSLKFSKSSKIMAIFIVFTGIIFDAFAGSIKERQDRLWDEIRFYGLTPGKSYKISSGTGFFIQPNYIVTNQHVVENCINIAARGAVDETLLEIVAVNKEVDLAVLKSNTPSKNFAYIQEAQNIEIGQKFFIPGYPGKYSSLGQYLLNSSPFASSSGNLEVTSGHAPLS